MEYFVMGAFLAAALAVLWWYLLGPGSNTERR